MFKKISTAIISLFAFLALVVFPQKAYAVSNNTPGRTTLKSDEVFEKDYIAADDIVELSGTVKGDAYVFGGQVSVDGKVERDLIVFGGEVKISGEVGQDLRVFGGQVSVSGDIKGSVTAVGGMVNILDSSKIAGSIVSAGGDVSISAPVGGNIRAAAGSLTLDSDIGGDVEAGVGQFKVGQDTKVTGNLNYWSDQEASIDPAAIVTGETNFNQLPKEFKEVPNKVDFQKNLARVKTTGKFISALALLLIGFLSIKLFPKHLDNTSNMITKNPWRSLGVGFAVLVLIPVTVVVLLITVVGIPLAFITLAFYFVALYFSKVYVVLWLGKKILAKSGKYLAFTVGLIVYIVVTLLPGIGGLIGFFVLLFGLGALVTEFTKSFRKS